MAKTIPIYLFHSKFVILFINYLKLKFLYFIDFFMLICYFRNLFNYKSILKLLSISQYFYHHFFDIFKLLFGDLYFPYNNLTIPIINKNNIFLI